jgi:hypothetical protein
MELEREKRAMAVSPSAAAGLVVRWNDELDLPHHVFSLGAPMTGASAEDAAQIAKRFVRDNSSLFDISMGELDESRVSARSFDERAGLTRLALEQRVNGVRVFDSEMLFLLDRRGSLVAQSGSFIPRARLRAPTATPALTAADALAQAARFCRLQLNLPFDAIEDNLPARNRTVFHSDELDARTEASLVYYPLTREELRLAYQVLLYNAESMVDSYLIVVDAHTGEMLKRDPLTYSFQAPMGRVFTDENPVKAGSRGLVALEGDSGASPQGWVSNGRSEGNNVKAYYNPELSQVETIRANQEGNFDYALDLSPGRSPLDYSNASVANLFYWVNLCHDKFYDLGFNEASRNFQANNFAKGGLGNDPVRADTLRGAKVSQSQTSQPVRNNAFFSATLEGTQPLLAMLMWNGVINGQPVELDSSYDAGVIIHEYAHGVSTRLSGTDNSLGLNSTQGRGMGEGWSDFFAMSFLNGDGPLDSSVSTGSYVTQRARGVRNYPYSTRLEVNPLTFGDIQNNTESHAVGTVWCTILWEMRQLLIERHGFERGKDLAERLVINGLKALPFSPTFINARDAILISDQAANAGANQDLIWRAFARRGLGKSATTTLTSPGVGFRINAKEGYDVPAEVTAGHLAIDDKPPAPAVIGQSLSVVISDRDLSTSESVEVRATNTRTAVTELFQLQAAAPGRFRGNIEIGSEGADGGPSSRLAARAGDQIVIAYANARNETGAAETIEVRTVAGRRIAVYSLDFEQGEGGWVLQGHWHMTQRRAASPLNSIYFAKRKGTNEKKSFTKVGSSGTAYSPSIDLKGLIKPRLEFDYYFSGALEGDINNRAGDLFTLSGRNFPFIGLGAIGPEDPRLSLTYDVKPDAAPSFRKSEVDLQFLGTRTTYLALTFAASLANLNRKKLEGLYIDNVRVTAVSLAPE